MCSLKINQALFGEQQDQTHEHRKKAQNNRAIHGVKLDFWGLEQGLIASVFPARYELCMCHMVLT